MCFKNSSGVRAAIALFSAVVFFGCSASYDGERLLWKAQQLSNPIVKDPTKATSEQYQAALEAYSKVITRAPGTVWAGRSQLAIGSLYAMQNQFDKAREAYALVLQNYNNQQDLCLGSRLAKARTYEVEKNLDEALKAYEEIVDYHPWSGVGLATPLYLARILEVRKETDRANESYQRAVRHYTKLLPGAPSPELAAQVKGYLAQAYESLGQWNDAIKILQELIDSPGGVNKPLAIVMVGSIYQTRLNDNEKAAAYYTKLINEFPEDKLVQLAKVQLERMGKPVPASASASAQKEPAPVAPSQ